MECSWRPHKLGGHAIQLPPNLLAARGAAFSHSNCDKSTTCVLYVTLLFTLIIPLRFLQFILVLSFITLHGPPSSLIDSSILNPDKAGRLQHRKDASC